ncbi:Putative membrane protein insertion efficiency factor [Lacunisphaera limnophila]|uniref:Putative membrane protein insertion efficiency factor n=1 Tax=Lacunisphaera limnophila TaxID=1838286 RepID=A0A1D8ATF2_9BACT|nr:membrane protein insertion efficiency factor YidD [Lacunisphaera limnophila]AOS44152.1 Putative membrane protein insertion efficiency factor [Lacunisphaera limnophila]
MPESAPTVHGAAPTPAPSVFAWVAAVPVRLLDALLWVYQHTVSPALSALNPSMGCRFAPTCSHYARGALREHGLFTGLGLTVVRLAKCGPWHPGGEDPVPPRSRPVCTAVRRQA